MASVIAASPALATANTYFFNSTTNNSILTADGGTLSFTGTVASPIGTPPAITASVSAWNATKSGSSYNVTNAKLGDYSGGLGVTSDTTDTYSSSNANCGTAGSCDQHQIDNLGGTYGSSSIDFVQIVFSKAVTLSGIGQVAFALPTTGNGYTFDNDFSYGSGTSAAAYANTRNPTTGALTGTSATLTQAQINAMFTKSVNNTGGCSASYSSAYGTSACQDTRTGLNVSADQYSSSTTWWIAASLLNPDNIADGFKLRDFTVVYNDAPVTIASVPEPASWTMMIGGFGLIGTAMRRKKAQGRIAAA